MDINIKIKYTALICRDFEELITMNNYFIKNNYYWYYNTNGTKENVSIEEMRTYFINKNMFLMLFNDEYKILDATYFYQGNDTIDKIMNAIDYIRKEKLNRINE